ncbi:MAG TPA: OmpA family protein [Polyangiaceae bacterium]|nr:OmpA family protein [Polyangiaceae bacterium]
MRIRGLGMAVVALAAMMFCAVALAPGQARAGGEDAPVATQPLDALDFDNGALLVDESASYATGTARWSAWRLSDGSESEGWCSAKGNPTGSTFVWELDTIWHLDTLALSTKNLEEKGYPGISAKTVELFVSEGAVAAGSASWTSVGRFGVGTEERREHQLPKGTRAARVKLVIVENHGNAEYTELAEVDLNGRRAGPPPVINMNGAYDTNYGPIRFVSEGDRVFGCYDWAASESLIWGTLTGRVARVTWWERRDTEIREGPATFAMSSSGDRIWGVWYEHGSLQGKWDGQRVPKEKGPKCQPATKQPVAESLKRQGRVVLYGIHFDTDSDVPRADSQPTLQELLGALQAQPDVRVAIEGHTDATAKDAYNLDLSSRRARAVVEWLVKRGIAQPRLEAKGYGRARPVADNTTTQGRALNRRVEASIIK